MYYNVAKHILHLEEYEKVMGEQLKERLYFREYMRDDLMDYISYRMAVWLSDSEITQKMNEELIFYGKRRNNYKKK